MRLECLPPGEVLYPDPEYFGTSTVAALKNYGLDWSHFNILSRQREAEGIEEDPDATFFEKASTEIDFGGIEVAYLHRSF